MSRKKSHHNRDQFNFHFTVTKDELLSLAGGSQEQLSPFEMKLRLSMKDALDNVSKRSADPLDRLEVAARMSRALGREITKTHIDQWVALSTVQRHMHIDALKAFCEVTGELGPLHVLVESFGLRALDYKLAKCAEFGASEIMRRKFADKQKALVLELDHTDIHDDLAKHLWGDKQ